MQFSTRELSKFCAEYAKKLRELSPLLTRLFQAAWHRLLVFLFRKWGIMPVCTGWDLYQSRYRARHVGVANRISGTGSS